MNTPAVKPTAWYRAARLAGGLIILLSLGYFVIELPGEYQDVFWSMQTVRISVAVGLSRRMVAVLLLAVQYSTLLVAGLTALLIYIKRVFAPQSVDWTALLASVTLMLSILISLGPPEVVYYPPNVIDQVFMILYVFMMYLLLVLLSYLMLIFPTGEFVPAWTRWLAMVVTVAWAGFGLFAVAIPGILWYIGIVWSGLSRFAAEFPDLFWILGFVFILVYIFALLAAFYSQTYRYRRVSTPLERQQTKWVVLSLALIPVYLLFQIVNRHSAPFKVRFG